MMSSTVLHNLNLPLVLCMLPLATVAALQCANKEPEFSETDHAEINFAGIGSPIHLALCKVTDSFKGCHIAWFKDGEPLERSRRVSFRSNGQDLFISTVEESDAGSYSCNVTSGHSSITRSLYLSTYREPSDEIFNPHHPGCKLDDTKPGGNVSAICQFRLDEDLLDLATCFWKKESGTSGPKSLKGLHDTISYDDFCVEYPNYTNCRDVVRKNPDDDHVYACLDLYNVTEDYYGKYYLIVQTDGTPGLKLTLTLDELIEGDPKHTVNSLLISSVVPGVLLLGLVLFLVMHIFKTDVHLYFKDHWGARTENDGKLYDAYISYVWNNTDTQFALSLKQHLEKRGYKVFVPEVEIAPGGCTVEEIITALEQSRRFIMILSNEYINGSLAAFEVTSFVDQVSKYKKNIISVVFKDSEVDAKNCRTILRHILRVSRVIKWAGLCGNATQDGNDNVAKTSQDGKAGTPPSLGSDINTMERSFKTRAFKELLVGMPPRPRPGQNSSTDMTSYANGGFSNNI